MNHPICPSIRHRYTIAISPNKYTYVSYACIVCIYHATSKKQITRNLWWPVRSGNYLLSSVTFVIGRCLIRHLWG